MKSGLLKYLVCPACRSVLDLVVSEEAKNGEILSGRLTCNACAAVYPVRAGVPRMLGEGH